MPKKEKIILGIILLLALVFRLYKIDAPLGDWHSWRQADTAAVSRNYTRTSIDLLHPRYDDLSNIQSGKYNPEGLRYVEFPIYNALTAILYKIIPFFAVEVIGRVVTIFFSLVTISIIFYLLYKEEGRIAAMAGALTYATFPFFVYYSRVVLPDTTAVSLMFIGIFFAYLFGKNHIKSQSISTVSLIISIVCVALALLTKPTVIFYLIPIMYIFYKKYGYRALQKISIYFYFLAVLIPLIAWRLFITRFPEGIPASDWLIFGVNTGGSLKSIFFRPAFFRWIFYERILNLILGGYMATFLIVGAIKKPHKSALFYSIALAALAYLFVFQGGNVQHDYYQIIILPALAIFVGIGVSLLSRLTDHSNKQLANPILLGLVVCGIFGASWFFSFNQVKDYYNQSDTLASSARAIKIFTEQDSILVTDTVGDTTLLYLSDRRGYPAVTEDLHDLKKRGADYFVTDKTDVIATIKRETEFKHVFENNRITIFKL
ncbi:hypothetical protein A3H83_00855 [Candidatus Roizmanbacteria bacterium RIFCSPLOWO2_02_FULL_39_8]|uniref:Glycosyltransferase RgtA/B/C/D-like domain-containing protein n=1 Tax=Candidatus Roizmanbacteria bacterium RIFCSPHIGHO2_01_FULL_39_24 TaxID=1802032 RepID=A0A1F7GJT3_9BACT|nr:MAG: hypothetical protein A2799_00425 [Candidatus Roizmanbacteria bacterium RIFCSPHIGHO2_01_FULL_39_24]OGK49584.1 MAG: hypothetical protein A3A56_04265 [Candidatus Roizmanbacteria bacterium RIFCSPLOWO2_01_FULL_40_32]OGK57021.1 MAG: hypothetical protein A3H83_00855 [Candidatus Roizmanbacteria bacterium RIFCSPLOWO2_02_FULL_39_8]